MTVTAPSTVKLRAYQHRAVDNVFRAWEAGLDRVLVSLPTGAGKSVVLAEIARRHLAHRRGDGPVVLLAHRRELVTQAAEHFRRAGPDLRVTTVIGSPGPKHSTRREKALINWRRADVLVTTVQTLASAGTRAAFPDPSLVIADEAHHGAAVSWGTVLTALGCFSGTRTLGVTATPFREDHRDLSTTFPTLVAAVDIGWMLTHCDDPTAPTGDRECAPGEGYLVPPTLRHLLVDGLDLSSVPTSKMSGAVDYRDAELAAELERTGAFDLVAEAVSAELADRKGIVFAPTVASSKYLAQALTAAGAPCHHLDGTMAPGPRSDILDDFRHGRVRWLSNVNIVSEGFDIPDADAVVLARPTQSRIFFRQSIGRALRPAPGKRDALILDVAGVSDGHTLAGIGLDALTDLDVLEAANDESLAELLARSDRTRRGLRDRISAHVLAARDLQDRGERGVEQLRLTAEGLESMAPGLAEFVTRAARSLDDLVYQATSVIDAELALPRAPDGTRSGGLDAEPESVGLDELSRVESRAAEDLVTARTRLGDVEGYKTSMRAALQAMRDEPDGEVAKAVVSGYVGTVRGELFGDVEDPDKPGAPGSVGALKLRSGGKDPKVTHPARVGWLLRSPGGHLYVPFHQSESSTPTALAVAVSLPGGRWLPVTMPIDGGEVAELTSSPLGSEADAYRHVADTASERTTAHGLLNPSASWRRKAATAGAGAWALAKRLDPKADIPDGATQGLVSDTITAAKFSVVVDKLGAWVVERVG